MRTGIGQMVAVGLALGAGAAPGAEIARIGALVLDAETRRPLAGVEMKGVFALENGWAAWKGGATPNFVSVRTDRDGRCTASARTNRGEAGWNVASVPEGYYRPAHGGWFTFGRKGLLGDWRPDNLVSTVLVQRVGHPVPLVANLVGSGKAGPAGVAPGGRLAYDLLRGDWLPPAGRGETADVEFVRGSPGGASPVRGDVALRFPGEGNGIVEIAAPDYAVPRIRTAPEEGYGAERTFAWLPDGDGQSVRPEHEGRNFCFRIRTRRDAEGRLVGGFYGKIYGGVAFLDAAGAEPGAHESLAKPRMGYFLNPAPLDRNLEWDRKTVLVRDPGSGRFEPRPATGGTYPCRGVIGPEP